MAVLYQSLHGSDFACQLFPQPQNILGLCSVDKKCIAGIIYNALRDWALVVLSWSWMLSAASFSLLQGFWDGWTDDNVQFPLLWGPLLECWCHKWSVVVVPSRVLVRPGGAAGLASHGRVEVLWKIKLNDAIWAPLSVKDWLKPMPGAAGWPAAVKFIFLTVKELQKGVSIYWAIPSGEQVTCTEEMTPATCSQKAHHCLQRTKAPPQSILQLLSHSLWQRDSLS